MPRTEKQDIQLGDIARDTVTGYQGTVVCIGQWLHGCKRITLQAPLKDGTYRESVTFDEPSLVLVEAKSHKPVTTTGGPRPEPTRNDNQR